MKLIHRARERGVGNHGWLKTRYSFSFADYFDAHKMGFGALRVLNDDSIAAHSGFETHPHRDMEIITLVRKGVLTHADSMGHQGEIAAGDIQVMSAGSGVTHSEKNEGDEAVELFQLWITSKKKNVKPRYDQKKISSGLLVSNDGRDGSSMIHQDAYMSLMIVDGVQKYTRYNSNNLVYAFIIEGEFTVNSVRLEKRDALGTDEDLVMEGKGEVLIVEVPMK